MATLPHLVSFHQELRMFLPCPLSSLHRNNPNRNLNSNRSRFCVFATKTPRSRSRKAKRNAEILSDIKEFLSTVGLPHDHVPSTKVLSQHGRQDLSNIVRRRGYKFIKDLLATSIEAETNICSPEENLVGEQQALYDYQVVSTDGAEVLSGSIASTSHQVEDQVFEIGASRSRRRKAKRNAEILSDIKEFLSTVGLPHDHVPATKELSEHGRQDLSNIVRRRGYKFIKDLLATTIEAETNICSPEEILIGEQQALYDYQVVSTGQNEEADSSGDMPLLAEASKLKVQEIDLVEDDSMSGEVSTVEMNEMAYAKDDSLSLGAAEAIKKLPPDHHISSAQESSLYPSLQEKVAKFIRDGELETIGDGAEVLNGSIASTSHQVEDQIFEIGPSRIVSTKDASVGDSNEDLEDEAQKIENQKEINRLKSMLHQKELELTQLKEQIENVKHALSMFQSKAEREISEAKKLISEKDAELLATEESLSGLEEVEIQFWSEGEVVEVAGSFNGWHQIIKMEPQPPSSISVRSQKSQLWKTLLWLYPGVYEIKFIVDGHWTVDPHMESVTRGSVHNNILRVRRA